MELGGIMTIENQSRPILVWAISILLGIGAFSQFFLHTLLLLMDPAMQTPEVQATIASWSVIDWVSPYILSALLMISVVLFFRLRVSSIWWFSGYLALVFFGTVQQAVSTKWLENFGAQGAMSALVQLGLMFGVLGYIIWLKRHDRLR